MQISTQLTIPPLACKQPFAQTLCAHESVGTKISLPAVKT
jgi:hypothetical protein